MRRYGPDLKLVVKRAAPDGKDPFGVAIDSSGRRVAVGYDDETSVSMLDAKDIGAARQERRRAISTKGNL